MCIYVYAYMDAICMRQRGHFQAARHFHALHPCGSAALSRTICMRQRGHFHSFTLKAARRHLGMSAATVCLTARAFEFVGVCSSLLEFVEFVLSWAVRVLRNRVNRVSRCASRCVSRCASRCANFSQPHALTRPRARWRWWRWVFSLALVARWRRVGEVVTIWRAWSVTHWSVTHCWLCPRGPVAVRRRALGAMPSGALGAMLEVLLARCLRCSWRGAPVLPELVALGVALGAAWRAWRGARVGARGAWRGACRLLGGPKKRRRSDTEDGDTCGRPAAGSATRRHVLVRLHTRLVRVYPSHSTNHTDLRQM